MRCYICDDTIDKPVFNRDHNDFDPCGKCLDVINHVFEDIPLPEEEKQEEDEISLDNLEEQVYNIS